MKRILLFIAVTFALLSCESQPSHHLVNGSAHLTLHAQLPEMPVIENPSEENAEEGSRATTQYTVRIKWAVGDKLSVINHTTGKILGGQLIADASGTSTTFSGSISGTVRNGDIISYLYPAQGNSSEVDLNTISIDMSTQKGVTGSIPLCVYATVVANDETFVNTTLSFSFIMSYVMISLSDIPASTTINKVILTNVTNAFELQNNGSHNSFTFLPKTGNITLTPAITASATGVKTVYAAVPTSEAMQRQVILETSTTNFSVAFTSAKLNNGYAYNTNVAGFLVDDLTITDKSMQEYCLQHFDANEDGKLSMVEVAGVTSFPSQTEYPIPSDVKQFNELEYFYGLTTLPSFKNCRSLSTITIPKQIKKIPNEMFYGCTTLIKVILKPTVPPTLGNDVFVGQAGDLILVVADDVVDDYQAAEGWRNYFDNFRTESSQNNSNVDIDTEGDDSMEDDRVDIIIK